MWCNYIKMSRTSVSTRYITASIYTCWAAIIWWLTWIPSRFSRGANLYTLSSSVKRNVLTTTHGLKAPAEKIPISSLKKENSQIYTCHKASSPLKWRAVWSTGKDPALEPGKAGLGCQLRFLRAMTRWLQDPFVHLERQKESYPLLHGDGSHLLPLVPRQTSGSRTRWSAVVNHSHWDTLRSLPEFLRCFFRSQSSS